MVSVSSTFGQIICIYLVIYPVEFFLLFTKKKCQSDIGDIVNLINIFFATLPISKHFLLLEI